MPKKHSRPDRMPEKELQRLEKVLLQEAADLLDIIWTLAGEDTTHAEIAREAGVSVATVHRYADGKPGQDWKYPRFMTIQKLAYAVDLHVVLDPDNMSIGLVQAKRGKQATRKSAARKKTTERRRARRKRQEAAAV